MKKEQDYIDLYEKILIKIKKKSDTNSQLVIWEKICKLKHLYNSTFVDINLEECISNYVNENIHALNISEFKDYVLFYDSTFSDSTVLSRQYLQALIDINKPFTYIGVLHSLASESKKIITMAKKCEKCRLVLISPDEKKNEIIHIIRSEIKISLPRNILLQMQVSDVCGVIGFSNISGTNRLFINHGDDQFWLGASFFDYYIHFSNSVAQIACEGRRIPREKNLILQYYPVIETNDFEGMPREIEDDDTIVFSGGRFSKIEDGKNTFMKIIKKVLEENKCVKFVFAGSGNSRKMRKFIKENGLENRWKIIKYRNDLYEFLRYVDLYLGTYPVKGGLMTQYAAYAGVPIIEMDDFSGFKSEELFLPSKQLKITYSNWNEYFGEINKLLNDCNYKSSISEMYAELLVNREIFRNGLENILSGNMIMYKSVEVEVNLDVILNNNIEASKYLTSEISRLMIDPVIIKYCPVKFIKYLLNYFFQIDLAELKSNIKKIIIKLQRSLNS